MASYTEEPCAKRSRLAIGESHDERRYRRITLDMERYDKWVHELSEQQLISTFDLGVKVEESIFFTVNVDQKFMETALSLQMKPVQETVKNIESEVKQQVQAVQDRVTQSVDDQMRKMADDVQKLKGNLKKDIDDTLTPKMEEIQGTMDKIDKTVDQKVLEAQVKATESVCDNVKQMTDNVLGFKEGLIENVKSIGTKLEEDVKSVTAKVPPLDTLKFQINESEKRTTDKLDSISAILENPNKKGARAEKNVLGILNKDLRNCGFTFQDTSSATGKGDIEAVTPDGYKIMIEVKEWKSSVTREAIEAFENHLAMSPDFKVGILLSMSSRIDKRSKRSPFEVAVNHDQKQYQIYVPNAYVDNEEHLIVWSVIMAEQLAKIEAGELGEKKTQKLSKIYEEFKDNLQHSKNCRTNLESLENSVKNLKANIVPILDTVDKTKNDVYNLLH